MLYYYYEKLLSTIVPFWRIFMALIECPECGKKFSDKAYACPNCGCPIEKISSGSSIWVENKKDVNKNYYRFSTKIGICGIIALLVVIAFFATSNFRKYNQAIAYMENENYEMALKKFKELGTYRNSVDQAKICEDKLTVDSEYLRAMAKGLMKRWDQVNADESNGDIFDVGKCYSNYCDIELKHIECYENAKFQDAALESDVKEYIDLIRKAKDATQFYNIDYLQYSNEWDETYAKRVVLIKIFVDNYGLQVDDEHKSTLNDILNDAIVVNSTPNKSTVYNFNRG